MAKRGKIPTPKTQREILNSQIEPYNPPVGSPGFSNTGNPNNANVPNRGEQISFRDDTTKPFTLGIKDIDEAIAYYMEEVIKPTVIQNGAVQQVPFIYGSPERWKQVQKDGYYRDKKGKIMLPLITFKRNNIEKVKWVITDEKFIIHFINDSKNLVGYVDYRKEIGLKPGDYGIFNTSQLIKCLNILDGDILVDATTSKLNMADTNYDIKFNLADPAVIPNVPDVSNNSDEWSVTFDVNDEFITRFVKSKDALSELETFTIETREGFTGEELVFTVGTNITNTIEFTVENVKINESFGAIPFDSNLMKEILKANKDYHSGEIRINKKGLLDAHLHCGDDLYTGYYLVRRQENN